MIRIVLGLAFLIAFSLTMPTLAQHPLIGTWKMISIKARGAGGEPFFLDTTSVREIKVITPTHYMLMAYTIEGDSLVFNRAYAGTVVFEGQRYLERPEFSSLQIFDNVNSNFTWKVEGNRFIQSGSFTRPDGKTIFLDEMIFERVTSKHAYNDNPAIGAWNLVSSLVRIADHGEFKSSKGLEIVTPTHWMQIIYKDNKFDNAVMGSYDMHHGKVFPQINFASGDSNHYTNVEIDQQVKGHVLYEKASGVLLNKSFSWEQTFEKR